MPHYALYRELQKGMNREFCYNFGEMHKDKEVAGDTIHRQTVVSMRNESLG